MEVIVLPQHALIIHGYRKYTGPDKIPENTEKRQSRKYAEIPVTRRRSPQGNLFGKSVLRCGLESVCAEFQI